ncbi:MAG: ABC transporter permease [Candidatus Poribacteria bacterium]|nr:ABC transporter permease [Candidatus Poribacteria bacterium]
MNIRITLNKLLIYTFVQSRKLLKNCYPQLLAICGFFLLCGLVLILRGQNPLEFYTTILVSGFSSFDEFGSVLFNSTPLIFTGLAVAIGYQCGLFNIGCEGQLYVAAFAATLVGIYLYLPSILLVPLCIGAAMIAGAVWGAVPGILKAKFGAHEVINTIMMNFIAVALTNFLVTSVYQEPNQMIPHTSKIYENAMLSRLGSYIPYLPKSNLLNDSFVIACVCVVFCHIFLKYTRWGYELRLVGNAPDVAAYGGIKPGVVIIWVMALSGAIAGLAGVSDVMGYRYRFLDSFSSGWGFTGIAVALLGRNHPFGVFAAALLFGLLNKVALDIELLLNVPRGLFLAGQGLLIIGLVSIESLKKKNK